MKTTNQNLNQSMPLSHHIKVIQEVSGKVARTITMFIREGTGFREIDMGWMIGIAIFLSTFGSVLKWFSKRDFGGFFELYPLVLICAAFYQRHKRWKAINNGELQHTRSGGISYLEKLPLPAFLTNHRKLYRYVEPALLFVVAMLCGAFFSQPFGRYLAFVSLADFIYENALFEVQLGLALDILDSQLDAQTHHQLAERFDPSQEVERADSAQEMTVIPSGVSQDILSNIKALRAKKAGVTDLAME